MGPDSFPIMLNTPFISKQIIGGGGCFCFYFKGRYLKDSKHTYCHDIFSLMLSLNIIVSYIGFLNLFSWPSDLNMVFVLFTIQMISFCLSVIFVFISFYFLIR